MALALPIRQVLFSGGMSAELRQFLNRVPTQSTTHKAAYKNLINGLVADGVWSDLDALYILCAQDSTTALVNLVSSNFNLTANGSPAFVANQGYTGVDASTTVYLDTNFDPTTATAPKYTQNAAHLSVWANTNVTSGASGGATIGLDNAAATSITNLFAKYSDGNSYYRINDDATPVGGIANSNSIGYYVCNRSGSTTQEGYKDAVSQSFTDSTSGALTAGSIAILAINKVGTGRQLGSALQLSAASIGGNLSQAKVSAMYSRIGSFRTAVGL